MVYKYSMNVLIVYATNSGGTQRATEVVSEVLSAAGHAVTRKKTVEANPDEIARYDLTILASPSWDYQDKEGRKEGQPHIEMRGFMEKAVGKTFPDTKFAVMGLGDTSYMYFTGAVDHLEKFVDTLQGQKVIDSLRIDGFYFDQDANEAKVRDWAGKITESIQVAVHQSL